MLIQFGNLYQFLTVDYLTLHCKLLALQKLLMRQNSPGFDHRRQISGFPSETFMNKIIILIHVVTEGRRVGLVSVRPVFGKILSQEGLRDKFFLFEFGVRIPTFSSLTLLDS